jgi:hypothetical protein
MKKDLLLSLAAIEAAPQRSGGIADSAVQIFIRDLLLMLQKRNSYGLWGHQPLIKKMKKDLLLSLAAIEAAPQRSGGIADSAIQMLTIDLLLMLLKKNRSHQKNDNCGLKNY